MPQIMKATPKSQTATMWRLRRARATSLLGKSRSSNGILCKATHPRRGCKGKRHACRTQLWARTFPVCLPGATGPFPCKPPIPARRTMQVPQTPDASPALLLSVVVPVRNEAANIAPLVAEIRQALAGVAHEIVYVDDGSTDGTAAALAAAAEAAARWCCVGIAPAAARVPRYVTGVRAARWHCGSPPSMATDRTIRRTYPRCWRVRRRRRGRRLLPGTGPRGGTRVSSALSSRAANAIRARLLGDATPDTGCGLKVFRRGGFPGVAGVRPYAPVPAGAVPAGGGRCGQRSGRASAAGSGG